MKGRAYERRDKEKGNNSHEFELTWEAFSSNLRTTLTRTIWLNRKLEMKEEHTSNMIASRYFDSFENI